MLIETAFMASVIVGIMSVLACVQIGQECFARKAIDVSEKYVLPDPCDQRIAEDDCAICCEPLKVKNVVKCVSCNNIAHAECLVEHIIYSEANKRTVRCIMGCE